MEIEFTLRAKEDIDFWKKSGNSKVLKKIRQTTEAIKISPFEGIGKPEPLKHELRGVWSRRITDEHRCLYQVEAEKITILSLKGHYE